MPAPAVASVLAQAAGRGTVVLRVRLVVAGGPYLPVPTAHTCRGTTDVQSAEMEGPVDDHAAPETLGHRHCAKLFSNASQRINERSRDRGDETKRWDR